MAELSDSEKEEKRAWIRQAKQKARLAAKRKAERKAIYEAKLAERFAAMREAE